jgi:hypothetical protein
LLLNCPALAVLLVQSVAARAGDRSNQFRDLLGLRWRDLAKDLGLSAKPKAIRLLRKIPVLHCHRFTVSALADAIKSRHPHVRLLSHLPKITRDTVALLRLSPEKVNAHLLLASSSSDYDEEPVTWCVDNIGFYREVEGPGRPWPYGRLDAEDLKRVEAILRDRHSDGLEHLTPFPEPPVPGVPGRITALRDSRDVAREGDEQVNCAESYLPAIIKGRNFLYSVTVLERATLALRRTSQGRWILEDLRAQNNQAPSRETQYFVDEWMAANDRDLSGDVGGRSP